MNPLFCCSSISPYRPQRLLHESKFTDFMSWSRGIDSAAAVADDSPDTMDNTTYVIQLVQQVNYGPLESKKYFARTTATQQDAAKFLEVSENDLIAANFKKLNAYKNFKCDTHNKFFELNIYEKDPVNQHHWRINVARPGTTIDL